MDKFDETGQGNEKWWADQQDAIKPQGVWVYPCILDTCTKITHEANQVETSENVTRNDETLTRWEKEFEAAISAYAVAEQELATPVVPTNVGENTNTTWSRATQPRANDLMKPNPLGGDAKLSELRAWQKRLKVFYDTHFMA